MGGAGSAEVDQRVVFSQLRRGDILGALAAVHAIPDERRPVALALLGAEAAACYGRGDLDELEQLRDRVQATDDATLALRMEAALADHHASQGSPLCGLIAAQALAPVSDEPLRDSDALWARGRLWRTLALASLFSPDDRPQRSFTFLDRAKADLAHAGFHVEWARCAADLHFVWTLAFGEDFDRTSDIVDESLARLRQRGSSYVDLVLGFRAYLDLAAGDISAAGACADEIDGMAVARPGHALTPVIVGYVRSASALVTDGPTPAVLAAIEDHLGLVRAAATPVLTGQMVGLASILNDLGHVDAEHLAVARRWAARAGAGESSIPSTVHDLAVLGGQLDLLEPTDPDATVSAMEDHLARGRQLGLRRDTARQALRAAVAARRAGLDDPAERWFLEGLADLPPPARRSFWERTVISSAATHRVQASAPITLRLLRPEVEVDVSGERQPLSVAAARLVVVLVGEGGAAPADRLVDALWPDADPDTGRGRLRVALHRLRKVLRAPDADRDDDPLPRRGDLVVLSPSVEVDAVRFEKLATGSWVDRMNALDLYHGAVAEAQLAYDDTAAPLRRRLAALWRELATEALARSQLTRTTAVHLAAVASRSASTDPDAAEILRGAESRIRQQ